MLPKLTNDILDNFLELVQKDSIIGQDLAKKIYESICSENYTKEVIQLILEQEQSKNEII